jgi:hypothetical protein
VPHVRAAAWASRVTNVALTSRHISRHQTLTVDYGRRFGTATRSLRLKITAIGRSGVRVTRYRTVRLRPAGFIAAQAGVASYVPA